MAKPRARDLGLPFVGTPGFYNAITDVPGILVGSTTLNDHSSANGPGRIRTGVTVIHPHGIRRTMEPTWAGIHSFNGNGEMTGTHWIEDAGFFTSPIVLTNTHAVGMAHHATVRWMTEQYSSQFETHHYWALPVVAETYDGVLNDINRFPIQENHVRDALNRAASGPIAEGNVGGGTGMICYGFKGGTGSASRQLTLDNQVYHVGVLVQANHGQREWLSVAGVPVGKLWPDPPFSARDQGSIIVIIATDIPMMPHQLRRVAKRAAIGIGRNGTVGGNNSGDIFLAFSVANPMPMPQVAPPKLVMEIINDELLDPIYEATCQGVEESVLNAMIAAESMPTVKPVGKIVHAIDAHKLMAIIRNYRHWPEPASS